MQSTSLGFSIIIEWENVKLSEMSRTRRMLSVLGQQVLALEKTRWRLVDIVIVYEPVNIQSQLIHDTLSAAGIVAPAMGTLKVLPVENLRYYELKNYGAKSTDSDVVIFLDSDVIPEPGWLETLLNGLMQTDVHAIGGTAYIDPDSLYSRAFALFWFFPLRSDNKVAKPGTAFFANNVAFKKSVFDEFNFPVHRKFRGQCRDLARTLIESGHGVVIDPAAQVSHPPPNGFYHFTCRALCDGYDNVVTAKVEHHKFTGKSRLRRFYWRMHQARKRIKSRNMDAKLGSAAALAAWGVAFGYYGLVFAGECITLAKPDFIPNNFSI